MPPPSLQHPPCPRPLAQPGSLCKNRVLWHLSPWSQLPILLLLLQALPGPPAHRERLTHRIIHCHSQRHQHIDTLLHTFKMRIPTYEVPPSYTQRHCQIHTATQTHRHTQTQVHINPEDAHPLHTLAIPHVHSFKTKLQKLSLVLREPAGALSTAAAPQASLNLPPQDPNWAISHALNPPPTLLKPQGNPEQAD